MKIKQYLIILSSLIIISCSSNKQEEKTEDSDGHAHHDHAVSSETATSKSPRTATMANIGSNHVHIDYSAPSVRGRQVFGGLVAFGEVWVTGAHSATPKGKYALFTIPGENEWIVIINENWDQHLADDYEESEDVLRIKVIPQKLENIVEQLNFKVEDLGNNKGKILFQWSDVIIQIPVETL
ncbi:DUF2911 domain-containing protein [Aquiflexum sp.]|uniref:DUF2911 domain-containing protein n=1 Tax=Aquiflexum sp. TaxID=1872584 RepID=UPI003593ADD5